jgi:hypothetical protein
MMRQRENAAGLAHVLVEPDAELLPSYHSVALDEAWHHAVSQAEPRATTASSWHDPFLISASSGSTGAPKLTMMTHLQYHFAISGMFEGLGRAGALDRRHHDPGRRLLSASDVDILVGAEQARITMTLSPRRKCARQLFRPPL